jgi:hypothetical protein
MKAMKTLCAILLFANCMVSADISAIKRRYSDREMALRRRDKLTAEMVAEMAIVKPEPEIQIIETMEQFITHLESKLAQYKSLLQRVEQTQANDREGTEEKFKAERAKGGPQYDGPPPYVSYERDKAKLRKKIQNAENKLSILRSCSGRSSKKRRCPF